MLARLAFFLLLVAPPIALAADTPAAGGKISVVAQPPPKVAVAAAPAPLTPLPAASPAPADASACRMDCAQSYYSCRTGDDADACGGGWSQCVAACSTPNLARPTSAAAP